MAPALVKSNGSFRNEVEVGTHRFVIDEPATAGGTDEGPTPYDLLGAALGGCTSMTLHFYAKREGIPLERVEVSVSNDRMYAKDCADCLTTSGYIHRFIVTIGLIGESLTAEQRERLMGIAKRCPVYKTLTNEIRIDEVLAAS
jgi:putative redox protein